MGRQPFGLASPAAWLLDAGAHVVCVDLAKERLADDVVRRSDVVAFFLPMHTATRLALPVVDRVRVLNPAARLVAYGLYAPLNEALLRARGVTEVLGGEFEAELVRVCMTRGGRPVPPWRASAPTVGPEMPRLQFRVPVRTGLLPLTRYATLQIGDERRTVGYTEASRGCKHRCRHCPIVPVYDGRFRVVGARGRARGHPRAGGRGRAAHHVRRSRLLQRHPARRGDRPRIRARVSGTDVRRHDQGRTSVAARRRCCRCCATPVARS